MQDNTEKPHFLILILVPLILFGLEVFVFIAFPIELFRNIRSLINMPDIVSFNKGHYYLLGLGVCVGVFGLIATLEHWFSIILSEATVKKLFRVAVLGLMLGLLLPHFSHFGFSRYFQSHGYISCDAASHRWLHSVILVYTKNEMLCKELIEARK